MLESTKAIIPELTLIIFAFYLTLRSASGKAKREALFVEALLGVVTALALLLVFSGQYMGAKPFYAMLVMDQTAFYFRVMFLVLALLVIFLSRKSTEVSDYLFGEYMVIVLTMTSGMCFIATATDVLMFFLALEWVSLSSYLLTAFIAHKKTASEAGIKYTLFGGIASAVMLFGISWLFGITGTLRFEELPAALATANKAAALFALILILLGFAFKVAAVPLHFWAPDVYQAAPTPISAFFSIGPKAAGFAILIRFFYYTMFLNP
jgi:NADH-quinone oxidoreductase subunit N